MTRKLSFSLSNVMHIPNMKLWTNTDSSLLMAQFQETRCFPD